MTSEKEEKRATRHGTRPDAMTLDGFLRQWNDGRPTVTVHTSGSTGEPKRMEVEKKRMEASALMTCRYLGVQRGDTTLLCMPLEYIAGKMVVVRALKCALNIIDVTPCGNPLHSLTSPPRFAAMVPMQVYNSLRNAHDRSILEGIENLIIGGGAIDDDMAQELASFPHNVWSTYGMTETLSHIALRRLSGDNRSEWYDTLPGVSVSKDGDGCLVIDAPLVCPETLHTHDIVVMSNDGKRFRIIGRSDNVIDTGGIKVHIEKVEQLLRRHLSFDFLITKRSDHKFGEAVVMLLTIPVTEQIKDVCRTVLPLYWRPRHYVTVPFLPYTSTGKPARAEAQRMAEEAH